MSPIDSLRNFVRRRGVDAAWVAALLALLGLRLTIMWPDSKAPAYFYSDSCPHVLFDWLQFQAGWRQVPLDPYYFPLLGCLRALFWRLAPDLFFGPIVLNLALGVMTLLFLYAGCRSVADQAVAGLSGVLLLSAPAFTRLILSGQPEILALCLTAGAFWAMCRAERGKVPRLRAEGLALLFLFLASYARSEAFGTFVILASFIGWRHRARPGVLATVVAMVGLALKLRIGALHAHAAVVFEIQRRFQLGFWQHVFFIPRELLAKRDASLALLALPAVFFRLRDRPAEFAAAAILGYGDLAARWLAGLAFLRMADSERGVCASVLLLCGAGAFGLRRWLARGRRAPKAAVAAVAASTGWALSVAVRPADTLPSFLNDARAIGYAVRPFASRSGGLLFEPDRDNWADVAVVSGLGQALRLVSLPPNAPSDAAGTLKKMTHQPGERAWGMLVRSAAIRRRLESEYGPSQALATVAGYELRRFSPRVEP